MVENKPEISRLLLAENYQSMNLWLSWQNIYPKTENAKESSIQLKKGFGKNYFIIKSVRKVMSVFISYRIMLLKNKKERYAGKYSLLIQRQFIRLVASEFKFFLLCLTVGCQLMNRFFYVFRCLRIRKSVVQSLQN